MFLIYKGELHADGIAFTLPDGWYIDTDCGVVAPYCLHLCTKDSDCMMDLQFFWGFHDAVKFIDNFINNDSCSYEYEQEVKKIENNGLVRYEYISLIGSKERKYEAIWELEEGLFSISIIGYAEVFEQALKQQAVSDLISSVRRSELKSKQ